MKAFFKRQLPDLPGYWYCPYPSKVTCIQSRERAIEFIKSNSGTAEHDVVVEIARCSILSGQATAYTVGMLQILRLREKAKSALGRDFKLKEFYDVVLRNGDIPLSILEQPVDTHIRSSTGVEQ